LVENSAAINFPDTNGNILLIVAAKMSNFKSYVTSKLTANVNIHGAYSNIVLHLASSSDYADSLKSVLDKVMSIKLTKTQISPRYILQLNVAM